MIGEAKTVSEAELKERARALLPGIRARADAAEQNRHVPEASFRTFREAGFFRLLQPRCFGGFELSYGAHTEISAEIARACPSSGWVVGVLACHAWIFGMFPQAAQRSLWEEDPAAVIATSFLPERASVARESGGFRVSGRWKFSSGAAHCQGIIVMAMLPRQGGPPDAYFLFLPRRHYRIEDNWNAAGLIATGSDDVVIENVFVPDHCALPVMDTAGGRSPGSAFHGNPLYALPLFAVFPFTLIGTALGAVAGALDFLADALSLRASVMQVKLAEQPSVQMRIAEAQAELDAAWALVREDRVRINEAATARRLPEIAERVAYRLHLGYAAKLCVSAIERLYPLGGARFIDPHNPLQRAWRDTHAVAQHIGLVWDIQAINYGAVRLGVECPDKRV
jgi:alkylation response protein AidB-like acyl-CoA dehydrogenase